MTRMTRRGWGLAALYSGLVIVALIFAVAGLQGLWVIVFGWVYISSPGPSVWTSWAWWIPPTGVVALILVFVGIALLASTRFKSEKKALT